MAKIYSFQTGKVIFEMGKEYLAPKQADDDHYNDLVEEMNDFFEVKKAGAMDIHTAMRGIDLFDEISQVADTKTMRDAALKYSKELAERIRTGKGIK